MQVSIRPEFSTLITPVSNIFVPFFITVAIPETLCPVQSQISYEWPHLRLSAQLRLRSHTCTHIYISHEWPHLILSAQLSLRSWSSVSTHIFSSHSSPYAICMFFTHSHAICIFFNHSYNISKCICTIISSQFHTTSRGFHNSQFHTISSGLHSQVPMSTIHYHTCSYS